jgi:formylglycine-generating enzyme required for sulfatase activity
VFAANPDPADRLAVDEEYRAIEQRIRLARHREGFQLISSPAARRSDVQDALLEHLPQIVHFACHGNSQADTLLLGDGRRVDAVSAEALASMFEVLGDSLVLVVFNACFASMQASVICRSAQLAIGMRDRIEDASAIAFASALYGALAYGRSVQDAFTLGIAALGADQRHVPELFTRPGCDAGDVYLARPRRTRMPFALLLGVAAVCGSLAVAGRQLHRDIDPILGRPRPVRGMVRFPAIDTRPGVFDAARRPAACSALLDTEDCAERRPADQIAPVHVGAFELDVMEVTNEELADWLTGNGRLWTADPYGRIALRQGNIPLGLASDDCLGALAIAPEGRVVVSAGTARWPAVCVTWYGATEYCRSQHKRLPLAMEWELAAKGAGGRPFPWGGDLPRQDGVVFDLRDSAGPHPRDVGSAPQDVSPEGIHDLGGNVAEWVEDGRGSVDTKAIRGGSWGSRGPCHLLGSGCKRITPGKYSKDVGFRCASSVIDDR